MLRIDARKSRELRAVIFALTNAEKAIQGQVRKQTKALLVPEWKEAMASQVATVPEARVLLATASATVSNQNIKLTSATKGRPLSGGLNPKKEYAAIEFGTKKRGQKKKYLSRARKRVGTTYFEVNRRTSEQLRPYRRQGYVFYPAVKGFVPRAAALWAQTTVRVLHEAFEGKSNG